MVNKTELENMAPRDFRHTVRRGEWAGPTAGVCLGYTQANLAVIPKDVAFDFFLFSFRNRKALPVIEVTEPGNPYPKLASPEADLRTDLPKYRVFREGKLVDEPNDIVAYWRDDLVSFLFGCIYSIDWELRAANVKFRRLGAYTSNIECIRAGEFRGPMAVSLRLITGTDDLVRAIQISSRFPAAHGTPVHIGAPAGIGIKDIYQADLVPYADIAPREPNEIPVFWGCGITVELVALRAKLPLMITHKGGHLFVTDRAIEAVAVL